MGTTVRFGWLTITEILPFILSSQQRERLLRDPAPKGPIQNLCSVQVGGGGWRVPWTYAEVLRIVAYIPLLMFLTPLKV